MLRTIFDLIVTLVVALAARAILGSLMKGFAQSARSGFGQAGNNEGPSASKQQPNERMTVAGELHKDPVCGMYVAESTRFQRKSGRDQFYYCSEECKEKHAVAAR